VRSRRRRVLDGRRRCLGTGGARLRSGVNG
jgi:hypothetical protein